MTDILVTPTMFKLKFPEFNSVDDNIVETFIDMSVAIYMDNAKNESQIPNSTRELAIELATAHVLALFSYPRDGNMTDAEIVEKLNAGGIVASAQQDVVRVSFLQNKNDTITNLLLQTQYGQQLLLIKMSFPSLIVLSDFTAEYYDTLIIKGN